LLNTELHALDAKIRQSLALVQKYEKDKQQFEAAIASYQQAITRDQTALDAIVVEQSEDDLNDLKRHWTTLREQIVAWETAQQQRVVLIAQTAQALTHYPLGKQYWERRVEYTAATQKEWQDAVTRLTEKQRQLNQQLHSVQGLLGQLKTLGKEIEQKQERLQALQLVLDTPAPGVLAALMVDSPLPQIESMMVANEQARAGAQGAYDSAVQSYQSANDRFQDLERRIEQNRKKLQLLRDLNRLKDLLKDDGLPLLFVKHKFDRLALFTQDGLVKMNANFFISVDKERELAFSFHRLDEGTKMELPMGKLSGGQKVRLCISFLMALQKTLLKDVGLLVADEPSTHVDSEGVEQIADFFISMKAELKNSEHQIWVVDHNPTIARALEKSLILTNN
jgi:DNA repair exonuclease SbcCD ATPase subunit